MDLTASQARADLYSLNGGLHARDGAISLKGSLDWRARRTGGLQLDIALADLSKWLALPKIGATRIKGTVAGTMDSFVFKGGFQGEKLDQFGYALARVGGPATVSLKAQEWRLQTNLAGAGGSGKGVAATLLGAAPRVQMDLSILKSGHLLFRTLTVAGAGLKIAAEGGQGLLGDLSFKGTGQLTNLAPLHAGAKGQIAGAWTASEGRDGKGLGLRLRRQRIELRLRSR